MISSQKNEYDERLVKPDSPDNDYSDDGFIKKKKDDDEDDYSDDGVIDPIYK